MLNQLSDVEVKELENIHQVIYLLSLAHRPIWKFKDRFLEDKRVIHTSIYLSKIHSDTENINEVLYDVYKYKNEIKKAIVSADKLYNEQDLIPDTVKWMDNIRSLLEIK